MIDEVLGAHVRADIVRLMALAGVCTARQVASHLKLEPEVVAEHLKLLEAYGWIVSTSGYKLTSTGRSSITKSHEGSFARSKP